MSVIGFAGDVVAELTRAEAAFPDRRIEITDDGTIEITMAPSLHHDMSAFDLAEWLRGIFARKRVLQAPPMFTSGGVRYPDVAVIDARPVDRSAYALSPDRVLLAVEFISPRNVANDRQVKMVEYARVGIAHYWIADHRRDLVTMYALDAAAGTYEQVDSMDLTSLLARDTLPEAVTGL